MTKQIVTLELTGVAVDLPPFKYPPDVWTLAQNAEMSEGFPRRARGFGRIYGNTLFLPRWLQQCEQYDPEAVLWFYGGDTNIAYTDSASHFDVTGTLVFDSTGERAPWTGGILNQFVIGNNRTGVPFYWNPGDPAAQELPDWPAGRRAGALRPFREYLIAMDITEGPVRDPDLIRWSDAAPPNDVPQSWTAGPQSQAGSASAAFTPGEVVDGLTLRDQFFIYKKHAVYVLSLVGGRFIMQQRPLFATFGALSKNCVVEYRGNHIVLTDGDVIVHNGVDARSLIDRRIRRALFENVSLDFFDNSFVALAKETSEVWVCIVEPGATYPTRAAVWSIEDDKWGIRDLGANEWPHGVEGIAPIPALEPTWAERTTQWNTDDTLWSTGAQAPLAGELVFADAGNLLQAIGYLNTFDGVDPVARLQRIGLDLGQPDRYKYVSRLWPKISGIDGSVVRVRAGGQDVADGPVRWGEWADFVVGSDAAVGANARGRYIAIEMESNSAATWRSPTIDLEVNLQGLF